MKSYKSENAKGKAMHMKIIVFGTGKAGHTILSHPLQKDCEIVAVVDNAKVIKCSSCQGQF